MTESNLPPLLDVPEIQRRLELLFPEGTAQRIYLVREMAARTVFVMLYVGAVEGANRWVRPNQVARMSNAQANRGSDDVRLRWARNSAAQKKGSTQIPGRWYADTSREPIRDETLRYGLIEVGAVVRRANVPTTSMLGTYALATDFAAVLHPSLVDDALATAIKMWRSKHLSKAALTRAKIVQEGIAKAKEGFLLVTFPNGETRRMAPGPSSLISKAVIEEFAPRFLGSPGVIFLSESGNKVVERDDALAKSIGLDIEADKNLPDIILVDIDPADPLLVFVEVVATDGPISDSRRRALLDILTRGGLEERHAAFVTAFVDRASPAYRKSSSEIAWDTFVWFASEPDSLVLFRGGKEVSKTTLAELLAQLST